MVRHGYRPWLGYDPASGGDRDIHLRQKRSHASLRPDATVVFTPPYRGVASLSPHDQAGFDALFPPGAPNKRNLMRSLYEIGI